MGLKSKLKLVNQFAKGKKGFLLASSLFTLAAVGDAYTTVRGLELLGDAASEINPIINYLIDNFGITKGVVSHKLIFGVPLLAYSGFKNTLGKNYNLGLLGLAQGVFACTNTLQTQL